MQLDRIKLSAIILMGIMLIPAYAQQGDTTRHLFIISESLAYEMGKTYQLARNCGQDLSNISAPRATVLFRNYFSEQQATVIMKQFSYSMTQMQTRSCKLDAIQIHALIQKMGEYMRFAAPFSRKEK